MTMLRTAILSLLVLLCGFGAASWLTHDFQVWTQEGARRLEVALHPVTTPPVAIDGPEVPGAELPAVLAREDGVTVVDFIYTNCVSVCLALGSSFQQMQARLEQETGIVGDDGVHLLSISFDGGRDTPEALAAYAGRLHANPALWQFVRIPDRAQEATLLQRYGITVIPDGRGDYEHNAALLIFDHRGRMVRIFDLAESELALNYARHLAAQQRAGKVL